MNLYGESNFVLELAYQQDQRDDCAALLELARAGRIELLVPAFCLGEPYETLGRRRRERVQLAQAVSAELGQLARSQSYRSEASDQLRRTRELFLASGEEERRRLDAVVSEVLDAAQVLPMDDGTIREALSLQRSRSLAPQDSIVYASILRHLRGTAGEECCFVTTNARDFLATDIEADLSALNCKLLTRFDHTLQYVRSRLASA